DGFLHQFLIRLSIMKSYTIVALAILGFAVAESTAPTADASTVPDFVVEGTCPVVDEKALWDKQKPNHAKFAGVWYEVARTNNPYQLVKECTHSKLTYLQDKGFQHVTMGLDAEGGLRRDGVTFPFITGANAATPHLSIQFENPSFAAPFVILDTDYDSYACIYSCMDFNNRYVSDFGFVWSRVPDMHPTKFDKCKAAFASISVDTGRLETVKHGDTCNYSNLQSQLNGGKTEL
ncbi:unnamed protein product, partial [Meganyctiphanes norvegica]